MSPEDQQKFNDYFDLFRQPGWARITEDLQESVDDLDSVAGLDSLQELGTRQGKILAFENMIHLEEYMQVLYDEMENQDAEEQQ